MTEIQERCAKWSQELQKLTAADDKEMAKDFAIQIYSHFVKNLPGPGKFYDHADFQAVVGLIKKMASLIPSTGLLAVGGYTMMKRPGCPYDENRHERVEANASTSTVIELFGLLAAHALAGYDKTHSTTNVMHLLRQVLAQNAHLMTIEEMKPFLEISAELSWLGRSGQTLLSVFQGPATPYFESERLLSNEGVDTVNNQAWAALLYNCFDGGPAGCELDHVLVGQPYAGSFDELTLKILQIYQAGFAMRMQRTDAVLISQILARMTHIVNVEAGTERAQHYATAIQSLVEMTVPDADNILDKNCIYKAVGTKKNPMGDDGFYNLCTVRSLKQTAVPLVYPETMASLDRFRYQVLLHIVHISPKLHKQDTKGDFNDQEHIAALADLCHDSLSAKDALKPLSPQARINLLKMMNDGPVRHKLMSSDLKATKEVFSQDLGL